MDALTAAAKQVGLINQALDQPFVTDSTPSFTGQRSFGSADQLGPTEFRQGINMDTRQAYAQTRRGCALIGAKFPTQIQGIWWYSTPAFAWLAVVSGTFLYYFNGTAWTKWTTGYAATNSTAQVCIAQLVNLIYLADGTTNLYSWDGATATDLGNNTGSSANAKPPVGSIVVSDTYRLWMAGITQAANGETLTTDELYCSALLEGATWDAEYLQIRVGQGDGDPITGLAPWTNNQMVVFKRNSIYIVTADPATTGGGSSAPLSNATVTCISTQIGCPSHRSIAVISQDVWFLSDIGITSLGLVLAQAQSEVKTPASLPVQDIVDRINWLYAGAAAGFFWNNRYMVCVPLDTDLTPSTIMVYNTLQQGWSGTWTQMQPLCWALSKPGNQEYLNFGRLDGGVYQWLDWVPLENETLSTFQDAGVNIPSSVTTRAMDWSDAVCPKSPFHVSTEFDESSATANVAVSLDEGTPLAIGNGLATTASALILPFLLPQVLGADGIYRQPLSLLGLQECRTLETIVSAPAGKISVRAVVATAFVNTLKIQ